MKEEELVLKAKNGDADAFSQLYGIYKNKLYGYAFFKLSDCEDAQDAVQDTILKAYEQISSVKNAKAFSGWIFRILYCTCSKKIEEQIKRKSISDIDLIADASVEHSEAFVEQEELKQALSVLSADDKNIVLLSVVAGLKSKEIAKITGLKDGTVRQRLSRSLSKMKSRLI